MLRQQEQQEKENALISAEVAKDQEIGDLRDVGRDLYQQLQTLKEQDKTKETEISRLHSVIPLWKKRVENLTNHMDTLANDHRDLMRDSKELQKEQENTRNEKVELVLMLKNVHENVEKDHQRYFTASKALTEARHHIEVLEQTVEDQDRRAREGGDVLNAERHRSHQLEANIAKLVTGFHELTTVVTGHPDRVFERMSRFVELSFQNVGTAQAQSQLELKSLLSHCLEILKEVRSVESLKPEDLGRLNISIRTYAQR